MSTARVGVRVEPRDEHRWLTCLAAAGLALAAALAVLGLPPLDLHGPLHRYGIMDPLCGGTRSVRFAARGEWATSWRYNPLGLVLLIGAAGVVLRAAVGAATGRWLAVTVPRRLLVLAVVAAAVVLQVRQQLNVELLTGP
jgi:hypothetical protein